MSEKSARERWLEMQYALAHRVLDDAGVPTETTVDGVPEQAVHCRIKILRARVTELEALASECDKRACREKNHRQRTEERVEVLEELCQRARAHVAPERELRKDLNEALKESENRITLDQPKMKTFYGPSEGNGLPGTVRMPPRED